MSAGRSRSRPHSMVCTLKSYRSTSSLNKILQIEPCLLEVSTLSLEQLFKEYVVSVKSKFGVDIRRVGLHLGAGRPMPSYDDFLRTVQELHELPAEMRETVHLTYSSKEGDTLPISNDAALEDRPKVLRVTVSRKGELLEEQIGYGTPGLNGTKARRRTISISKPQDFRRVSSLMDADILPHELRRVRLCKFENNRPLGFYIRDGMSERITPWGLIRAPGIFISRLLPNGLAASTNLLHVNDEVLEVNGIVVADKSLDQVTDIMIANSSNLVLTIRPSPPFPFHPQLPNLNFPPPPPYPISPPRYPEAYSPLRAWNRNGSPQHALHGYPPHPRELFGGAYCRPAPPLHAMETFSRASTWRVSDKTSSSSSRSNSSKSRKQKWRPLSVHYTMAPAVWPPPPNVQVF